MAMNFKRKESAINLYKSTQGEHADKLAALTNSDKAYTEEEIAEILEAVTAQPADEPKEVANAVKTEIVEDGPLKSVASGRRNPANVGKGEMVTIKNSWNGAVNTMPAEYALKLVNKPNSTYSIVK